MDEGQVVSIFSAEQVRQLTGLSARQLRYWDQTGFFSPTFVGPSRGAYNRVYSYREVVGLRAVAVMRKAGGQGETSIEMDAVDRDVREGIVRLRERRADQIGQVSRHRHTAGNEPVIAGTRVPTGAVWTLRQAGFDHAAMRREYPRLTERDLGAALDWEARRRAS